MVHSKKNRVIWRGLLPPVFFFGISSAQQWIPLSSGTARHLHAVHFSNANTGYAVGDSGTVLRTADGGANWTSQTQGSARLTSVYFPAPDRGYAVGYGVILTTRDGGLTWNLRNTGNDLLQTVHCVSVDTCFAGGSVGINPGPPSLLLKTANGGASWIPMNSGLTAGIYSLHFPSIDTGYALGNWDVPGPIFKTVNGGSSWSQPWTRPAGSPFLWSTYFPNSSVGYTVGDNGDILKTTDGGVNWTGQRNATRLGLKSVHCLTANICHAVGDGGVIVNTTNGGMDWLKEDSVGGSLHSVHFPASNTGYTVGAKGAIFKWSSTVSLLSGPQFFSERKGYFLFRRNGNILIFAEPGRSFRFFNVNGRQSPILQVQGENPLGSP